MPLVRLFIAVFTLSGSALLWAADPNPFSGYWIEQADDPLKITLRPLEGQQIQASISHGHSDISQSTVYQQVGLQLLGADGTAVYALERGKLRKLDTSSLVLFIRSGDLLPD